MARATARQEAVEIIRSRFVPRSWRDPDDVWPEEPTAVDAAMTMEEMIVEEIRRQGAMPPPANDGGKTAKKGTLAG